MSVYALAVHSSLGFKKYDYFFRYKGREFRYVPQWSRNSTDKILTTLRTGGDGEADEVYRLAAECLSAVAFERDSRLILSAGMIVHAPIDLADFSGGYEEPRKIPVMETMQEFFYVPPIRTEDQKHLIKLYREARASNSVYFEILFYWHILAYPDHNDQLAAERLEDFLAPSQFATAARIRANPMMLKNAADFTSLGQYVKNGDPLSLSLR